MSDKLFDMFENRIDLDHDEFIVQNAQKKINIHFPPGFQKMLPTNAIKVVNVYAFFYKWLPLIAIPIFCYFMNDWWLLFGIPISFFCSVLAKGSPYPMYLSTVVSAVFWYKLGFSIHQHFTFYLACGWAGFIFYRLAVEIARDNLIDVITISKEYYNYLRENGVLILSRK